MPLEWINFPDQTLFSPAYDKFKRYITMLYYSCMNLGVGEFGPANTIEFLFCYGSMLCSFLFNALIFGDVVTLVQVISKKQNERQQQLDDANSVMIGLKIDNLSQEEIREFLQKT